MAKIYRSAMGRQIDVDHILLRNEDVIAVGNMKVNGRGDELGPGGKVVKTRDQIMKEYYSLNTPVAADPVIEEPKSTIQQPAPRTVAPAPAVPDPVPVVDVIEEPVFNANSGMDEIDDGPETVATPETVTPPTIEADPVTVETAPAEPAKTPKYGAPQAPKPEVDPNAQPVRGTMARSVAGGATVTQTPKTLPKKSGGIQRF